VFCPEYTVTKGTRGGGTRENCVKLGIWNGGLAAKFAKDRGKKTPKKKWKTAVFPCREYSWKEERKSPGEGSRKEEGAGQERSVILASTRNKIDWPGGS